MRHGTKNEIPGARGDGKMSKVPLKKLERTSRAKHFQKKKTLPFIALTKLIVLALKTLMIMKSNKTIMKENIIPPNYGDLIKPKILLEAHLTPLITGLSVGEGIPAMV